LQIAVQRQGAVFMTSSIPNYTFKETVKVGYKNVNAVGGFSEDLTKYLYSLPTLNVGGSSATNTLSLSLANGVQCLNFIGGARLLILQSATLTQQSAVYIFANTSGTYPVSIQLDNGGTIGGLSVYLLNSGAIVRFTFDGTNLN
jgi:hypothetical protein